MRRCFPISPPHWKGLPWPWGRGRRGPGAPGATATCPAGCRHALPAPDMPRRGKAQSPDSEEEEGRLLPSCCPASPSPWCPAEPAPKPPWWLGLCAGGAGAAAGRLCAAVACARACLLPVGRIPCAAPREAGWEGRFPQPSLQLTAAPLRGFLGGGSSRAVHCPSSSIFPGSCRARFSAATLSLSSCHGQTPSKEDCSLQAVPKLGYNSNQT